MHTGQGFRELIQIQNTPLSKVLIHFIPFYYRAAQNLEILFCRYQLHLVAYSLGQG